jgi:hypothetical protein
MDFAIAAQNAGIGARIVASLHLCDDAIRQVSVVDGSVIVLNAGEHLIDLASIIEGFANGRWFHRSRGARQLLGGTVRVGEVVINGNS